MDRPDSPRPRDASASSRRAAIGRALLAHEPGSTDPAWLSLTEEERQNGLALFRDEDARATAETFEQVPDRGDVFATDRAVLRAISGASRPRPSAVLWQVPLLVAMLMVVAVAFALMSGGEVREGHAPPNTRLTTSNTTSPEFTRAHEVPPAPAAEAPAPSDRTVALKKEVEPPRAMPPRATPRSAPPGRERERVRPAAPVQAALVPRAPTVERLPIPEPAIPPPLLDGPPVELRPAAPVAASAPRVEPVAAPVRPPAPEAAIQSVLSRYRSAYKGLDVGAARAVWPSVDAKALSRAFERLEQQEVVFDYCQIAASDANAVASCVGSASYVPRAGSKVRHDDQRQWDFTLRKAGDAWLIDTVLTR